MAPEKMNSLGQNGSTTSFFSEEVRFPAERQVGFWKSNALDDPFGMKISRMSNMPGCVPIVSLPIEESQMAKCAEIHDTCFLEDQKVNAGLPRPAVWADRAVSHSVDSWSNMDHRCVEIAECNMQSSSFLKDGYRHKIPYPPYDSGIFSSSLSELFSRKLRLSVNNNFYGHSVDTVAPPHEAEEPSESLKELEAQTIGNLLPNDDDLFAGVVYGFEQAAQPGEGDDTEDLDFFTSVGGMDLGVGENNSCGGGTKTGFLGGIPLSQPGGSDFLIASEHSYVETPSRTLFVGNINSNLEDSELRAVFEKYGDINAMYSAWKHRGFVMISYYDIRAAWNAKKALQDELMGQRKLDIHFSIPMGSSDKVLNHGAILVSNLAASVSNDYLHQIFGTCGGIKVICEAPGRSNSKLIEFYDVRAAEAALRALNQIDIAGKRINLEPHNSESSRTSSAPQLPPNVEQDGVTLCVQGSFLHQPTAPIGMKSDISLENPSEIQTPVSSFRGSSFHHGISSSVPSSLSSFRETETPGALPDLCEPGTSLDQIKYDFHGGPTFHPQSFPENPDGFTEGVPSNSPIISTFSGRLSINGQSNEVSGGFSSSVNGSCPVPGSQYTWNSSNGVQSPSSIWTNSPSFDRVSAASPSFDRVSAAYSPSRLPGFPRTPNHMLKSVVAMNNHYVGSAPTVNHSIWDRRRVHFAESADASGNSSFQQGPIGSMGLSGGPLYKMESDSHNAFQHGPTGSMKLSGSPSHKMEFDSHNSFLRVGGNCIDLPIPSRSFGVHSHNYRSMLQSERAYMNSFQSGRSRRSDSSSSQEENKKKYELDLDRILQGEDSRTTLMIKNIPNKYTSKMLMAAINERHRGTYDFIYLPIDFKNKCNVGYAFINMIDPGHIIPFYETFNGKKWEKFNSEKVASLAYGRIQGKQALIAHFQNSSLMNEDKRCRPILFHTDGTNAGEQIPFPMGTEVRTRTSKTKSSNNGGNHRESDSKVGSPPGKSDASSGSGKDMD